MILLFCQAPEQRVTFLLTKVVIIIDTNIAKNVLFLHFSHLFCLLCTPFTSANQFWAKTAPGWKTSDFVVFQCLANNEFLVAFWSDGGQLPIKSTSISLQSISYLPSGGGTGKPIVSSMAFMILGNFLTFQNM